MAKKIKIGKGKIHLGSWAFLIGFVAAVTIGLFNAQIGAQTQTITLWSLIIIGIIVGLFNVTRKESSKFLLASLTLVIVSYMSGSVLSIIPLLGSVLYALLIMFVPTTIIVALRLVFEITKD